MYTLVDAYTTSTTFSLINYVIGHFPVPEQYVQTARTIQQETFRDAMNIYRLDHDDHDGLRVLQAKASAALQRLNDIGLPPISIQDHAIKTVPGTDSIASMKTLIRNSTNDSELCRKALLQDYLSVPDVYIDLLIQRLKINNSILMALPEEEQAMLDEAYEAKPHIHRTLKTLTQTKPERFSSDLSIVIYLDIFNQTSDQKQRSMLALVSQRAASDVRAMPLLDSVLKHHIDKLSEACLPKVFEAYARHYGSSSRMMDTLTDHLLETRPDLMMACARAIFTEEGAPLLRINQDKFFKGLNDSQRTQFISSCYRNLTMDAKPGWKELAMVSAYQIAYCEEDGDVPEQLSPWDNFHNRYATTDQNTLKDYATSLLVKIVLSFSMRDEKSHAAKVYDYIRNHRSEHLSKGKSFMTNGHLLSDCIPGASQAFQANKLPTIYKLLVREIR
jgi:hypothetical protein